MLKGSAEEELERLLQAVLTSAKYREISPDLIRNIGRQELGKRRNLKEAVKSTKNRLHQVCGAYLDRHEHYEQWVNELERIRAGDDQSALREFSKRVMGYHASTRERLPILEQFYGTLLAEAAPVQSVLDIACGLNPLAMPWMPLAKEASYYACDIYRPMLTFLEQYMEMLGIRGRAEVRDVLQDCPTEEVDVALVLKTLPCLEQIEKQAGSRLLHTLRAKRIIVSFPVHSLGGKSKGMADYYESHFQAMVANEPWDIQRIQFATELVFVVKK